MDNVFNEGEMQIVNYFNNFNLAVIYHNIDIDYSHLQTRCNFKGGVEGKNLATLNRKAFNIIFYHLAL